MLSNKTKCSMYILHFSAWIFTKKLYNYYRSNFLSSHVPCNKKVMLLHAVNISNHARIHSHWLEFSLFNDNVMNANAVNCIIVNKTLFLIIIIITLIPQNPFSPEAFKIRDDEELEESDVLASSPPRGLRVGRQVASFHDNQDLQRLQENRQQATNPVTGIYYVWLIYDSVIL